MKYTFSFNGEEFDSEEFDTREDARIAGVESYIEENGDDPFEIWTGTVHPCTVEEFVNSDWLLDQIQEAAWDELGEYTSDWQPTLTADQAKELAEVIDGFFTKHSMQPTFFRVENVERVKLNEPT